MIASLLLAHLKLSNLKVLLIVIILLGVWYVDDLVVLFDQHAVHERIRLETLTEGAYVVYHNYIIIILFIRSL